jgi:hypothetical protein
MFGRRAAWIAHAVIVVVTLALAHDLTFLARYGSIYGEALAHAGHGPAWTTAVLVSLGLGTGLVLAAAVQLWRLRATAGATEAGPRIGIAGTDVRGFGRSWAGWAARLGAVVAVLLTVQENVERAAIGIRAADPAILVSPEYAGALGIVTAVATAAGFVVALFRWRRDALLARIRAAVAPRPRPRSTRLPQRRVAAPSRSILGRGLGLRAPPPGVAIGIAA